jgi:hypothetical protein
MASSHGVPRFARNLEGDGEKEKAREKEQIHEYRSLLESVNAKVRHHNTSTTSSTCTPATPQGFA